MAQRKRSKLSKRTGTNKRLSRQLNHLVARQVMRTRIPRDPPPLKRGYDLRMKLPINVYTGLTTGFLAFGDLDHPAVYSLQPDSNHLVTAMTVTVQQIAAIVKAQGFNATTCYLEWALLKVQAWGPPTSPQRSYTSRLTVDTGADTNALTVTDTGTATNRPAISLSAPFESWFCGGSKTTEVLIRFDPDVIAPQVWTSQTAKRWDAKDPVDLGTLHLTVHLRVTSLVA